MSVWRVSSRESIWRQRVRSRTHPYGACAVARIHMARAQPHARVSSHAQPLRALHASSPLEPGGAGWSGVEPGGAGSPWPTLSSGAAASRAHVPPQRHVRMCSRSVTCACAAAASRAPLQLPLLSGLASRACVRACVRACLRALRVRMRACLHACVRARACVRACVCACVRACVCARARVRRRPLGVESH
jgi:hypothetical protein